MIHSAVKHFHETHSLKGDAAERHSPAAGAAPHFITCTVEHDSVRLPLEHLVEEHVAGEWPAWLSSSGGAPLAVADYGRAVW